MRNACVTHAQCLPGLCNLFNGRTRAGIIQHGACALRVPCERKATLEREQVCRGAAPPRIAPSALVGSRPRFCCPSEVGGPEARHSPPALAQQPPQGQVARQPVHGDPFPCHGPHPAHAYATLQRLDQGRATCPAGKPARRGNLRGGAAVQRCIGDPSGLLAGCGRASIARQGKAPRKERRTNRTTGSLRSASAKAKEAGCTRDAERTQGGRHHTT